MDSGRLAAPGLSVASERLWLTTIRQRMLGSVALGVAAMLLIGLFACTAPLLRALRIVPTVAMRAEP